MYPPIQTGTSFYSRNLARSLAKAGNSLKVIAFTGENSDTSSALYSVENIPALKIPLRNYFKHLRFCSLLPGNYRRVVTIAREFDADVILLINHYLDIAFPAIVASRINRIPLVCSVGTQLQSCNPLRNQILHYLDRLICGHLVFPFCDRVVAWDNEILRYLQEIHRNSVTNKAVIVNFGVNGDVASMLAYDHDYCLHNQILGVGAVCEQRSFVPLVEAFALIAKDFPDMKLKIIGHVYYDAAVKRAHALGISNRVVFTGELEHALVLAEFKRSDAYFVSLTGSYVGLGTATIEAMFLGIPAIANVPANLLGKAMLRDMEDIILCYGLSSPDIADKMRTLFGSEEMRKKIGMHGRNFVAKNLDWKKVAQDMDEQLSSVISEYNRRR